MKHVPLVLLLFVFLGANASTPAQDPAHRAAQLPADIQDWLTHYCLDCHNSTSPAADLDLSQRLSTERFDGTLLFENLITQRMPPPEAEQPTATERKAILEWLANRATQPIPPSYRRISRHEYLHRLNDLFGVQLDIAQQIPDDQGTYTFDTDRRIQLSREQLQAYFSAADKALEVALPLPGFPTEKVWTSTTVKDSHETYNLYVREQSNGLLFSWTRANNGNGYSYFYDHIEPTDPGWYELTLDAAKWGEFTGDVSIMVYAGKYFYADDRPQPQRLLGVLSVGHREVRSHTLTGYLNPGENVSVLCYSPHTWRQADGNQGAYIERFRVRGPVLKNWPPVSLTEIFAGLPLRVPRRETQTVNLPPTRLQQIGGQLTVSSFQEGMEPQSMLDRSSKTFWHSRFTPDVAPAPHYVIVENPKRHAIAGLAYSTWTQGNGNGQVKAYAISVSDDGISWSEPIATGSLEVMHAAEQTISFPAATAKPWIRFLVTDAVSLDGKSIASIGGLDVILAEPTDNAQLSFAPLQIVVDSQSEQELQRVIRRFAQRAFSTELSAQELEPFDRVALETMRQETDFVAGARAGLKAIVCSNRFLLAPGTHSNRSYRLAADLARSLWLSVPDERLLQLAQHDALTVAKLSEEIERMLQDPKANRLVHALCSQWLNLRGFNKIAPSLKLYPDYNDLLNYYLPLETEAYLSYLIRENEPISRIIHSDFAILNQRLAEHYEIAGVNGQEFRLVKLPPHNPRGGLLTMGSILKVTSDGFQTSPILRGAWISKNIVGNTLSPPPPGIKAIEPNFSEATTLKEQIAAHKQNPTCYGCHKQIDPYGFALENFDATGKWRTHYRIEDPHQGTFSYRPEGYFHVAGPVDASSELEDQEFADVLELKQILLAKHKQIAYNFARKFFEYLNGYAPNLSQRLDLYAMLGDEATDCGMRDLITQIVIYSLREPQ